MPLTCLAEYPQHYMLALQDQARNAREHFRPALDAVNALRPRPLAIRE